MQQSNKTCATGFLIKRLFIQLQIRLIFVFVIFIVRYVSSGEKKMYLLFNIRPVKNKFIKIFFIGCASIFLPTYMRNR